MNHAIILGGGSGTRIDLDIPKQFYKVNEKPILVYTLESFQKCESIDYIYAVVPNRWVNEVLKYKGIYGISKLVCVTEGGPTGICSAYNGLLSVKGASYNDLVLFHDGVRPFIDVKDIEHNIEIALEYGDAVNVVPCVETLVKLGPGEVTTDICVPRDGLMRVQTPQTFTYGEILKLLADEDVASISHPSLFSFWMSKGRPIHCSLGSEKNIKITYNEDLVYFKKLFS